MLQYLTQTNEANSMSGEIYRNSGMVHSEEKSEVPPPFSMFHQVGQVAKPRLVPTNCLRYLQTH